MCVCVCVCVHGCVCMDVCVHVCMDVCTCVCACVCTCVHVCMDVSSSCPHMLTCARFGSQRVTFTLVSAQTQAIYALDERSGKETTLTPELVSHECCHIPGRGHRARYLELDDWMKQTCR